MESLDAFLIAFALITFGYGMLYLVFLSHRPDTARVPALLVPDSIGALKASLMRVVLVVLTIYFVRVAWLEIEQLDFTLWALPGSILLIAVSIRARAMRRTDRGRSALTACFGIVLLCAVTSSARADAALVAHPLQPPDTSSPSATLRSFVTNLEQAFRNAAEGSDRSSKPPLDRAVRCLDLSKTPPELRGDVGVESALLLKEVLDRVEVPPFDEIPDRLDGAGSWMIPHTPIAIRRVAEGERAGEYLFSPDTVARVPELYQRIREYPYREGATPGLYMAYLTTPGSGLERGWSKYLPEWSQGVFAEQTWWQWIALLVTLLALTAALTPAARLARAPPSTGDAEAALRPRLRPRLVVAVAVGAAAVVAADYFIDEVVNLTGKPLVFIIYILVLLRYVFVGWLAALLVLHAAELVIRARGLDANAAGTALIRLASWVVVGLLVVGLLVAAGQDFGFPVYSIVTGLGVGGIAIGFGAQSLVRDVLSGVFFLIDDAFRMGEYIDVGSAKGRVERFSIRSLQLRHHRGAVHTIPFGEIQTLTNFSRDWVIMKLPMRLTYDTNPQKVKNIVKEISAEMADDPELGPSLLEPPKSQGVLQMDDSAMILRVKFMAKPGEQFVLRRELLHRIRAAFEREGIRFASREVTVHVSGDADDDVTREAAAGAARRVLDDDAARVPSRPDEVAPAGLPDRTRGRL